MIILLCLLTVVNPTLLTQLFLNHVIIDIVIEIEVPSYIGEFTIPGHNMIKILFSKTV